MPPGTQPGFPEPSDEPIRRSFSLQGEGSCLRVEWEVWVEGKTTWLLYPTLTLWCVQLHPHDSLPQQLFGKEDLTQIVSVAVPKTPKARYVVKTSLFSSQFRKSRSMVPISDLWE